MECQTFVPLAPEKLNEEVSSYLPVIAEKHDLDVQNLELLWDELASHISFHHVEVAYSPSDTDVRDLDDLPYIYLHQRTGAPIYSKDKDIPAMGGSVIGWSVVMKLKEYSSHAAIEYTIKSNGIIIANLSAKAASALFEFIKSLGSKTKQLPPSVLWVAGGVLAGLIIHPKSRAFIVSALRALPEKTQKLGKILLEAAKPLMQEHNDAKIKAEKALSEVKVKLEDSQLVTSSQ